MTTRSGLKEEEVHSCHKSLRNLTEHHVEMKQARNARVRAREVETTKMASREETDFLNGTELLPPVSDNSSKTANLKCDDGCESYQLFGHQLFCHEGVRAD